MLDDVVDIAEDAGELVAGEEWAQAAELRLQRLGGFRHDEMVLI